MVWCGGMGRELGAGSREEGVGPGGRRGGSQRREEEGRGGKRREKLVKGEKVDVQQLLKRRDSTSSMANVEVGRAQSECSMAGLTEEGKGELVDGIWQK